MNWVGGARSRLRLQHEKKLQREFFDKQKFTRQVESARPPSPKNRRSGLSLDLLAFQTVNKAHCRPNAGQRNMTSRVTRVDLDKHQACFTPIEYSELPMSPIKVPSSIDVNSASSESACIHHGKQLERWKAELQREKVKVGMKPLQSPLFSRFDKRTPLEHPVLSATSLNLRDKHTAGITQEMPREGVIEKQGESERGLSSTNMNLTPRTFDMTFKHQLGNKGPEHPRYQVDCRSSLLPDRCILPVARKSKWRIYTDDAENKREERKRNAFAIEDFQVTPIKRRSSDTSVQNRSFKFPRAKQYCVVASEKEEKHTQANRHDVLMQNSISSGSPESQKEDPLFGLDRGYQKATDGFATSRALVDQQVYPKPKSENPQRLMFDSKKGKYCPKSKFKNLDIIPFPFPNVAKEAAHNEEDPLHGMGEQNVQNIRKDDVKFETPIDKMKSEGFPFLSFFRNVHPSDGRQSPQRKDIAETEVKKSTYLLNVEDPLHGLMVENEREAYQTSFIRAPSSLEEAMCSSSLDIGLDSESGSEVGEVRELEEDPLGKLPEGKLFDILPNSRDSKENCVKMNSPSSVRVTGAAVDNTRICLSPTSSSNPCSSDARTERPVSLKNDISEEEDNKTRDAHGVVNTSDENSQCPCTPSTLGVKTMVASILDGLLFNFIPSASTVTTNEDIFKDNGNQEVIHEREKCKVHENIISSALLKCCGTVNDAKECGRETLILGECIKSDAASHTHIPEQERKITKHVTTQTEIIQIDVSTQTSVVTECQTIQTSPTFQTNDIAQQTDMSFSISKPVFADPDTQHNSPDSGSQESSAEAFPRVTNYCSLTCGVGQSHKCNYSPHDSNDHVEFEAGQSEVNKVNLESTKASRAPYGVWMSHDEFSVSQSSEFELKHPHQVHAEKNSILKFSVADETVQFSCLNVENISCSQHEVDTASSSQDSLCGYDVPPELRRSKRFCFSRGQQEM